MLFLRSFFAAGFLPPLNGFSHGRPPASICLSRYWWFSGLQSSQKYCLGIFFLGMPMHWVCCHALQLSHWIIMRPSSSSFAPHTQRITSSPLAPSSASGDVDLVGCDCDLRFLGRGAGDDGSAWMSDRRLLTPLVERTLRRGSVPVSTAGPAGAREGDVTVHISAAGPRRDRCSLRFPPTEACDPPAVCPHDRLAPRSRGFLQVTGAGWGWCRRRAVVVHRARAPPSGLCARAHRRLPRAHNSTRAGSRASCQWLRRRLGGQNRRGAAGRAGMAMRMPEGMMEPRLPRGAKNDGPHHDTTKTTTSHEAAC